MASVHRDPRFPKGPWNCSLTLADGRRVWRSTKKRNKREAKILCDAWQQAEIEAANGELTQHREQWLEGKQKISPRTRQAYKQVDWRVPCLLGTHPGKSSAGTGHRS